MNRAVVIVFVCLGCPSKEPTSTAPSDPLTSEPARPTATAATTQSAPDVADASTPEAADALAPTHPRGKPTSFGGGIPGQCINCPPMGCPESCNKIFKGK